MGLENCLRLSDIKANRPKYKKIFLYRVCGTGMGATACLLKQAGLEVEGGDVRFEPPMSDYLKETGIPLYELSEINEQFFKDHQYDLIVVGNVVPKGSEDAKIIENSGIDFCSFPAALGGLFLCDKNVVGVAGTHGKTTTTYFLKQIFTKLGYSPGYFIGGVLADAPSSSLGESDYFFIESDEYDSAYFEKISKFRLYELDHMILTSLEFDHADIFANIHDIQEQFRPVLEELPGSFIYDETYSSAVELISSLQNYDQIKKIPYATATTGPSLIHEGPEGSVFDLIYERNMRRFETNLVGRHNLLNLSACLIFCETQGVPYEKAAEAVKELFHVKRRQEVRGRLGSALVIDDFAHHPKAVELTLLGLKTKYPGKKLTVVFEPNSATARSSLFQEEFTEAFKISDRLLVTKPSKPTSVKFASDLNLQKMVSLLVHEGKEAGVVESLDQLLEGLKPSYGEENLIVILSNGTCLGFWESDLAKNLV
jgi:UDP-N-acetylmuramate: L-alanyl-gamma-D-glutamyl-meso-diaminopimelate ligase